MKRSSVVIAALLLACASEASAQTFFGADGRPLGYGMPMPGGGTHYMGADGRPMGYSLPLPGSSRHPSYDDYDDYAPRRRYGFEENRSYREDRYAPGYRYRR